MGMASATSYATCVGQAYLLGTSTRVLQHRHAHHDEPCWFPLQQNLLVETLWSCQPSGDQDIHIFTIDVTAKMARGP
ncbi:hypothetical protein ANO14919_010120 [Xylariales sp. No.14919]|nr:hypothetical protein ANO14919_010120 [Xylariales sp. No.14919]